MIETGEENPPRGQEITSHRRRPHTALIVFLSILPCTYKLKLASPREQLSLAKFFQYNRRRLRQKAGAGACLYYYVPKTKMKLTTITEVTRRGICVMRCERGPCRIRERSTNVGGGPAPGSPPTRRRPAATAGPEAMPPRRSPSLLEDLNSNCNIEYAIVQRQRGRISQARQAVVRARQNNIKHI